ncbi:hypothetical protein BTJ40_12780 [Microbulbifer sp. A4B17]|uniref:hypothetical protein n=1 Tax=unclassified Microbulbifer TaxID=2619833 RepID=UPI000D52BEB9|nr:hypothetical protein [Microbulbifer sp. A4B17]AWF81631.1 hypothetical protein BTJ40_12780 [Microbulbifer sp. A4B17]
MQPSHKETLERYDVFRAQARDIAKESLPGNLKGVLNVEGIDHKTLNAFQAWKDTAERKVSWDWEFSRSYKIFYPKSFDMSVWLGNTLCSMSLGRPTFKGTEMRLDFIERAPKNCPYAGEMFSISLLAYEIYGDLIGAKKIRIMEPMNDKLIKYYMSHGGFKLVGSKKGNPHYLVRDL